MPSTVPKINKFPSRNEIIRCLSPQQVSSQIQPTYIQWVFKGKSESAYFLNPKSFEKQSREDSSSVKLSLTLGDDPGLSVSV